MQYYGVIRLCHTIACVQEVAKLPMAKRQLKSTLMLGFRPYVALFISSDHFKHVLILGCSIASGPSYRILYAASLALRSPPKARTRKFRIVSFCNPRGCRRKCRTKPQTTHLGEHFTCSSCCRIGGLTGSKFMFFGIGVLPLGPHLRLRHVRSRGRASISLL